jgi:hypothetical protein
MGENTIFFENRSTQWQCSSKPSGGSSGSGALRRSYPCLFQKRCRKVIDFQLDTKKNQFLQKIYSITI